MSETDSLKKIVKGSSIVFIGIFISKFLAYVYRLLIARVGPEQYGLFSIALGLTGILVTISVLGLNLGLMRYIPFFKGKEDNEKILLTIRESLKLTAAISLFFSILVFFLSEKISIGLFNNHELIPILKIMSLSIFFGTLTFMLYDLMIAFQKAKYHVLIKNFFENAIKIVLTFILIYIIGIGALGAAYGYLFSLIISLFVAIYMVNKYVFRFITIKKIYGGIKIRKELVSYSMPLMFSDLSISIIVWTDTLILGHFRSATEVGIYNAALPTAHLMYLIPYALMMLFLPVLTETYSKGEKEVLNSIYLRVTKWIFFTNLMLVSFFVLFSRIIMKNLFGQEYISGNIVLIILSLGLFLGYLIEPTERMFMIFKKTKTIFLITISVLVSSLSLNFMLIPIYGMIGAAIAAAITQILIFLLYAVSGYIITKINPFKFKYFLNALILLSVLGFIKYFFSGNLLIMLLMFMGYILLSILLLAITNIIEKEDILFIKLILKKISGN